MTKAELVERAAQATGLTKRDTGAAVDAFIRAVADALAEGKNIEIRGFGCFKLKQRKGRKARNPRTGDEVFVDPRTVPVFQVSREIKGRVGTLKVKDHK